MEEVCGLRQPYARNRVVLKHLSLVVRDVGFCCFKDAAVEAVACVCFFFCLVFFRLITSLLITATAALHTGKGLAAAGAASLKNATLSAHTESSGKSFAVCCLNTSCVLLAGWLRWITRILGVWVVGAWAF
ncbi:hypothetical protein TraAM80_06330 [Trypanosoma rangeli]|uniref:Uncharacterized protein n=1 Tax=Trypanosoma rangeli TaxID=5698 RepID=A0A3R7MAV1_TRYRA|nr:uncharacterized protein TraAM80_06330 [Trypanosoma rangeli]RNF02546.1 hypothetical protein TraAM80_06330 [Trypanosoma rangeli]|eukprot:RNF02546.1 hypothetical protein TraAM80_06330 [Trypanosoma rangeli]